MRPENHRPIGVLLLFLFGTFVSGHLCAQPGGYAYGRQLLITGAKVVGGTDLVNFPVLVNVTAPELRHVSNGGHVQSSQGYDILFTSADCHTPLPLVIESYNGTTGQYIAWVRPPRLSPGVDQNLHLYYGRAGVTDPSDPAVWSGYHAVWHFNGGSFADATGNGHTPVNMGTTLQSPAYLAEGRHLSSTQWMELNSFPNMAGSFTMSAWIYTTNNGRSGQRVFQDDEYNSGGYALSLGDGGTGSLRIYARASNPVYFDTPANTIQNNTWYHVMGVIDMTTMTRRIHVNGVLVASDSFTGWGTDAGKATIGGESAIGETENRFEGRLDEVRVASSALSATWAQTEYNNQSAPSAFYTLSPEYSAGQLCLILPIELLSFTATPGQDAVQLAWTTASEKENERFTVLRSLDLEHWEEVLDLPGAGNSSQLLHYNTTDPAPLPGSSYYRLRQTDIDGTFSDSDIRAVHRTMLSQGGLSITPNPAKDRLYVSAPSMTGPVLCTITDAMGRQVGQLEVRDLQRTAIPIDGLYSGCYVITLTNGHARYSGRLLVQDR